MPAEVAEHKPVLLKEVLEVLRVRHLVRLKKDLFIDATLGLGGHAIGILSYGGKVLGIEADRESLDIAKRRINLALRVPMSMGIKACPSPHICEDMRRRFILVHGNFRDIREIALRHNFEKVYGILFDLGVSSYQLSIKRGFSLEREDAPLDMRIDLQNQAVTARDIIKIFDLAKLKQVFGKVLEKRSAQKLAEAIVDKRREKEIVSVGDLLSIIHETFPRSGKLYDGYLIFLALRMAVNSELEDLKVALPQAFNLLASGGRLAVITFHSGEDRVVKRFFKEYGRKGGKIVTRKPITAKRDEIQKNPRSRSAKMRVLEKI